MIDLGVSVDDYVTGKVSDFDLSVLNKILENSRGESSLSDEDLKLAIVCLIGTCARQEVRIQSLISQVAELKATPKKFWQFWK